MKIKLFKIGERSGFCQEIFKSSEGRYYARTSWDEESAYWYTFTGFKGQNWERGEADTPLKKGIILEICNEAGIPLFSEEIIEDPDGNKGYVFNGNFNN